MCRLLIVHLWGWATMLQCVSVHVCAPLSTLVCSLVFVCACPCVTGWAAAVLESLLTESVGPAEYFYPLACVREQVEALWVTTRSHSDEQRYALSVPVLAKRWGLIGCFTKTEHTKIATGRMEVFCLTLHSFCGENDPSFKILSNSRGKCKWTKRKVELCPLAPYWWHN